MEYSEYDLTDLLQETMTEQQVVIILYNSLKALNFIHSANIIHRDLKPSNILVGRDSRIMICDFGLARVNPPMPP